MYKRARARACHVSHLMLSFWRAKHLTHHQEDTEGVRQRRSSTRKMMMMMVVVVVVVVAAAAAAVCPTQVQYAQVHSSALSRHKTFCSFNMSFHFVFIVRLEYVTLIISLLSVSFFCVSMSVFVFCFY